MQVVIMSCKEKSLAQEENKEAIFTMWAIEDLFWENECNNGHNERKIG